MFDGRQGGREGGREEPLAGEDDLKVNSPRLTAAWTDWTENSNSLSSQESRPVGWGGALRCQPGLPSEISSLAFSKTKISSFPHFYFYLYLKQIRHKLELDLGERNVITRINMIGGYK